MRARNNSGVILVADIRTRDGEQLQCVLTFDNGATYTCKTSNTGDHVLQAARINENEGITSGNPLGIMSSNSANISIVDTSGELVITNTGSPFYGYMRNGVKLEFTLLKKNGQSEPFGIYYTDDWDTQRSNGGYSTTNLNAKDYLDYIGNMEVPELDAFSSVEISELLVNIFHGLGLSDSQFYIDPSLNLELTYSITKGNKVRDTLNGIANALIARITINRAGVIEVKPAFPEVPEELDTLNSNYIISSNILHNTDSQYNKVRLDYTAVGLKESEVLASLNNFTAVPGENSIDGISIPSNTQGIDGVYFTYDVNASKYKNIISDVDYTGYQGGVSLTFTNETEEDVIVDISIEGRTSGATKQSIYREVNHERPIKVANLLILNSDYIQTQDLASKYIDSVANYLSKISSTLRFTSILNPSVTCGTYFKIIDSISTVNGLYYLNSVSFVFGEQYSVTATGIKIVG